MARGKRVELVKITVDGAEVDAKECTKCSEVKPLPEFHRGASAGGRYSRCRDCVNEKPSDPRPQATWTTEKYSTYVRELTKGEYEFIDSYEKGEVKSRHFHHKCGLSYMTQPRVFISGSRCPHCFGSVARCESTRKNYALKVYEIHEDIEVEGEYVNANHKIRHKHLKCGYSWDVRPADILRGRGCPKCAGVAKKTHQEYCEEIRNLTAGEYEVISFYKNSRSKVTKRHICGHVFTATPSDFLSGTRCPRCSKREKISKERFAELVEIHGKGEYEIVGDFVDSSTNVDITHNPCGYVWNVRPTSFVTVGVRCPRCAGVERKTHKRFVEEIFDLVGEEYRVLGKYTNTVTKVEIHHNTCGNTWYVRPGDFLKGSRCPRCSESRGEREIRIWLSNKHIQFEQYKKFDGCRNINPLPFDFAIPLKRHFVTIEYDGEQHSRPVDFAGKGAEWAEKEFRKIQRNDRIKTDYCLAKGIPLIRIDYTEFDEIESILTRELTKLGVISSETGNRLNDAI